MSIKIAITIEKGGLQEKPQVPSTFRPSSPNAATVCCLRTLIRRATQPCTTVCIMPMIRPYMTPSPVFGR